MKSPPPQVKFYQPDQAVGRDNAGRWGVSKVQATSGGGWPPAALQRLAWSTRREDGGWDGMEPLMEASSPRSRFVSFSIVTRQSSAPSAQQRLLASRERLVLCLLCGALGHRMAIALLSSVQYSVKRSMLLCVGRSRSELCATSCDSKC